MLYESDIPAFEGTTNADLYSYVLTLKEELRRCKAGSGATKNLMELRDDATGNPVPLQ